MAVWKKDSGAGQDLTLVPRFTRAGMLAGAEGPDAGQ